MIRRPPRSTPLYSSAASDVYKRQSVWLAGGVQTGFPPGSALGVESVVVNDGVASVALALGSAGDPTQRSLAQQQMLKTLTQLPTVQDVMTTAVSYTHLTLPTN